MGKEPIVLEVGDGIVLRQYVPSDASAIFKLIDESREHLSQHADDTAAKYPTVESVENSILNPRNPDRLRFGIWVGDTLVGSVNITQEDRHTAVLGYWLGERHQRMGYARRAAFALVQEIFKSKDVRTVVAYVVDTNDRSAHLLEQIGFVLTDDQEGTLMFTLHSSGITSR